MSDRLFGGPQFYSNAPVATTVMSVFILLATIPSLFSVSSLLLVYTSTAIAEGHYWCLFIGPLVTMSPDALLLVMFCLYIGRGFEQKYSSLAYLNLMLFTYLAAVGLAVGLCYWPYYRENFLFRCPLAFAGSSAAASCYVGRRRWKTLLANWVPVSETTGAIVALVLCATNKLAVDSVLFTAAGALVGVLVCWRVPPFYLGCRKENTAEND